MAPCHTIDGSSGGQLANSRLRRQEAAVVNRWECASAPSVCPSILVGDLSPEALLGADVRFKVPDDHAAVSATARKDRRAAVAPRQGICRRRIMTKQNHVGLTRLHFVLVRGRLLKIDVPYVNLMQVRVRGDDATVLGPALEAVHFSWMDENLAHLQPRLQALEALLTAWTISFQGHPSI